jgi:predicted nucleic acid-binding protein
MKRSDVRRAVRRARREIENLCRHQCAHTDDKFLACAVAGGAAFIVSGDRALQRISGYSGIEVVGLRRFVEAFPREK